MTITDRRVARCASAAGGRVRGAHRVHAAAAQRRSPRRRRRVARRSTAGGQGR